MQICRRNRLNALWKRTANTKSSVTNGCGFLLKLYQRYVQSYIFSYAYRAIILYAYIKYEKKTRAADSLFFFLKQCAKHFTEIEHFKIDIEQITPLYSYTHVHLYPIILVFVSSYNFRVWTLVCFITTTQMSTLQSITWLIIFYRRRYL